MGLKSNYWCLIRSRREKFGDTQTPREGQVKVEAEAGVSRQEPGKARSSWKLEEAGRTFSLRSFRGSMVLLTCGFRAAGL